MVHPDDTALAVSVVLLGALLGAAWGLLPRRAHSRWRRR